MRTKRLLVAALTAVGLTVAASHAVVAQLNSGTGVGSSGLGGNVEAAPMASPPPPSPTVLPPADPTGPRLLDPGKARLGAPSSVNVPDLDVRQSVAAPAPGAAGADDADCKAVLEKPAAFDDARVRACREAARESIDRLEESNKRAVRSVCPTCLD